MSIKTGDILLHVADILMSKANGDLSPMRRSFQEVASKQNISAPQMQTVLKYASSTGQNIEKEDISLLWHLFKDGISKCVSSVTDFAPVSKIAVKDFIIFSNWTHKNYSMMMNLDGEKSAPKIFSRASSVSDFQTFLSYLNQTIVPALKKAYCAEHKIGPKAFDLEIATREQEILEQNIPGSEIIKPIPVQEWANARDLKPSP